MRSLQEIAKQLLLDLHEPTSNESRYEILLKALEEAFENGRDAPDPDNRFI